MYLKIFFIGVLKVYEEKEQDLDPDPDPSVRGTDPKYAESGTLVKGIDNNEGPSVSMVCSAV
jgi:hypothetical protein